MTFGHYFCQFKKKFGCKVMFILKREKLLSSLRKDGRFWKFFDV